MEPNIRNEGPFVALHAPSGFIDGDPNALAQAAIDLWSYRGESEHIRNPAPQLPVPPESGGPDTIQQWIDRCRTLYAGWIENWIMGKGSAAESIRMRVSEQHNALVLERGPFGQAVNQQMLADQAYVECVVYVKVVIWPWRVMVHWNTGTGFQEPAVLPVAQKLGPHWRRIEKWSDPAVLATKTVFIRCQADQSMSPTWDKETGRAVWRVCPGPDQIVWDIVWDARVGGIALLNNGWLAVTVPQFILGELTYVILVDGTVEVDASPFIQVI
ncbi:MAG: hypothetical protein ABIG66_01055 [Candidatus Kerfeldbacteria bacterium]